MLEKDDATSGGGDDEIIPKMKSGSLAVISGILLVLEYIYKLDQKFQEDYR